MDPGVGDQVGLELVQIHVNGSVKPQGGGDGGHDLGVKPVQVGVGGALDINVPPADVIDSLVVDHEGAVTVLESGVGIEGGVAGLNHDGGHLWSGVDAELKLGLLAVVHGESLHQQAGEPGFGTSTE